MQAAHKEVEEEEEGEGEEEEEEESDEEVTAAPPLLVPAAGPSGAQPAGAAEGRPPAAQQQSLQDSKANEEDKEDAHSVNARAQPLHALAGSASPGYAALVQLRDDPQAATSMEASQHAGVTGVLPSAPAQPLSDKWDEVLAAWDGGDSPPASSAPAPAQQGDVLLVAPTRATQPWAPGASQPAQQAAGPPSAHPLVSSLDADPSYGWLNSAAPLSLREAAGAARPPSASSHASHAENRPPPHAGATDSPERPLLQGVTAGGPPRSLAAPAPVLGAGSEDALGAAAEQRRAAEMLADLEARARLEMEGILARIEKHFKASRQWCFSRQKKAYRAAPVLARMTHAEDAVHERLQMRT